MTAETPDRQRHTPAKVDAKQSRPENATLKESAARRKAREARAAAEKVDRKKEDPDGKLRKDLDSLQVSSDKSGRLPRRSLDTQKNLKPAAAKQNKNSAPSRSESERLVKIVDKLELYFVDKSREIVIGYRSGKRDEALVIGRELGFEVVEESRLLDAIIFRWAQEKPLTKETLDFLKTKGAVIRLVQPSSTVDVE